MSESWFEFSAALFLRWTPPLSPFRNTNAPPSTSDSSPLYFCYPSSLIYDILLYPAPIPSSHIEKLPSSSSSSVVFFLLSIFILVPGTPQFCDWHLASFIHQFWPVSFPLSSSPHCEPKHTTGFTGRPSFSSSSATQSLQSRSPYTTHHLPSEALFSYQLLSPFSLSLCSLPIYIYLRCSSSTVSHSSDDSTLISVLTVSSSCFSLCYSAPCPCTHCAVRSFASDSPAHSFAEAHSCRTPIRAVRETLTMMEWMMADWEIERNKEDDERNRKEREKKRENVHVISPW